jgi:hypothetical protein
MSCKILILILVLTIIFLKPKYKLKYNFPEQNVGSHICMIMILK